MEQVYCDHRRIGGQCVGRDELMVFISTNRNVFDALQMLLLEAHNNKGSTEVEKKMWHAQLVGTPAQIGVLVTLAIENGLKIIDVSQSRVLIGVPSRFLFLDVSSDLSV